MNIICIILFPGFTWWFLSLTGYLFVDKHHISVALSPSEINRDLGKKNNLTYGIMTYDVITQPCNTFIDDLFNRWWSYELLYSTLLRWSNWFKHILLTIMEQSCGYINFSLFMHVIIPKLVWLILFTKETVTIIEVVGHRGTQICTYRCSVVWKI